MAQVFPQLFYLSVISSLSAEHQILPITPLAIVLCTEALPVSKLTVQTGGALV